MLILFLFFWCFLSSGFGMFFIQTVPSNSGSQAEIEFHKILFRQDAEIESDYQPACEIIVGVTWVVKYYHSHLGYLSQISCPGPRLDWPPGAELRTRLQISCRKLQWGEMKVMEETNQPYLFSPPFLALKEDLRGLLKSVSITLICLADSW